MAAEHAWFEVVESDAGWHARFRSRNGRIRWSTESYTTEAAADDAVNELQVTTLGLLEVKRLDERETKAAPAAGDD